MKSSGIIVAIMMVLALVMTSACSGAKSESLQEGRSELPQEIKPATSTPWTTFTTKDGLASNEVWAIFQDKQGNLWFGTFGDGVSCYDGTTWRTFTTKDGLAGNRVLAIAEDNKGNLWFGTNGGASRYDGTSCRTFTHEDGLAFFGSYDYVRAITLDDKGNLWFGTGDGSVSCYDGTTWETFTVGIRGPSSPGVAAPPLPSVEAIIQNKQGNIWIGTNGGGVSYYDGTNWHTFNWEDGLDHSSVETIFQDKQGNLWFGTRWHSIPKVEFTYPADYPASPATVQITESPTSPSSSAAVSCYDGTNWRTFNWQDGLLGVYTNAIAEDSQGNLWVGTGTDGGINHYDGTTWHTFTTEDGLANNDARAIFIDKHDNLWIGTNGGGVSCYSPER